MHIALVSQEYPPETAKGGIGSQALLKAHGLVALGHKVHVISRSTDGRRTECSDAGVQVIRVPGFEQLLPIGSEVVDWLSYSACVAAAVAELHGKSPLDLVEFPEWGCEGYIHLLNRTEWNHVPTVIHLHGPLVMFAHTMNWPAIDSEFYRTGTAMESTCLRLADAVFSSSHCSAAWCAKHYGLKSECIPVLHTGVDTELFAPRILQKTRPPLIIFSGKLARNKGVLLLLEAVCRLAGEFPEVRLRLLGRGDAQVIQELEARARVAGQDQVLELAGFVDRRSLSEQLNEAAVFAAPSEYEGGPGFAFLEAMSCGLPVIGCSGSGASEVIRHGENGLFVPPNDVEALVVALRSLLNDRSLRESLGERARQFVLAEADSRHCIRRLEQFYLTAAQAGQSQL
jgi:1,4-alpha-glucan branching enzyme